MLASLVSLVDCLACITGIFKFIKDPLSADRLVCSLASSNTTICLAAHLIQDQSRSLQCYPTMILINNEKLFLGHDGVEKSLAKCFQYLSYTDISVCLSVIELVFTCIIVCINFSIYYCVNAFLAPKFI